MYIGVRTNVNKFFKCLDFTSSMDAKEKLIARYKLGLTIQKIISNNLSKDGEGLITSLRKLAASSDTEYSIIQKITSGKKDPQFSTLAAIIDGFGISFSEFSRFFDSITKDEIDRYKSNLKEKLKQPRSSSNKSTSRKVTKGKK